MKNERERKFKVPSIYWEMMLRRSNGIFEKITDYFVESLTQGPPLRFRIMEKDFLSSYGHLEADETPQGWPQPESQVAAIKIGYGRDRKESEYNIDDLVIPPNFGDIRLFKSRNPWIEGPLHFHVETYLRRETFIESTPMSGNFIAEVEAEDSPEGLKALIEFVPFSDWIEVTEDDRFKSYNIAKFGWPKE